MSMVKSGCPLESPLWVACKQAVVTPRMERNRGKCSALHPQHPLAHAECQKRSDLSPRKAAAADGD
eukprot:363978-Chlamydomonas_euryale.AAC.2